MQVGRSQDQEDGNTQQGVLIASSIFWSCCTLVAISLAYRTRMSYLALIRHSTQAGVPTRAAVRVPVLTTCLQVHPLPQAPVVDVMSRIISAPAYGQVHMSHASVPIGTEQRACAGSPPLQFMCFSAFLPAVASGGGVVSALANAAAPPPPHPLPPGVPDTWSPQYGEQQ